MINIFLGPIRIWIRPTIWAGLIKVGVPAIQQGYLPFADPKLRTQVQTVIDSVDSTGSPPPGVYQGGAIINGQQVQGLYKGGGLPKQPLGYCMESDVWPSAGPDSRDAVRLVFGANDEVYFTHDHYNSFARVR